MPLNPSVITNVCKLCNNNMQIQVVKNAQSTPPKLLY
jgi:hypothetical protein